MLMCDSMSDTHQLLSSPLVSSKVNAELSSLFTINAYIITAGLLGIFLLQCLLAAGVAGCLLVAFLLLLLLLLLLAAFNPVCLSLSTMRSNLIYQLQSSQSHALTQPSHTSYSLFSTLHTQALLLCTFCTGL